MAVLLLAVSAPQTAQAEDFKVNWNNGTLMYDGHQYYSVGEAKQGESHGLPVGAQYYSYVEDTSTGTTSNSTPKAHVIYFAPGADPPTATTATYVTYNYPSLNNYQNRSAEQSVEVVPAGESNTYDSQCAVEDIGWIICGASVSLAKGMDWLFDLLSSFIAVQPPVIGDAQNDLYIAWNIARTVANIAFIIAFLIIIYSQLTNVGVSNYGIKKLIPRLVIAAIAVNLSFYITAFAIDLSNILGYSLQDLFVQVRNGIFNVDNDSWRGDTTTWEAITTFVLAGGGAGLAGIAVATGGSIASAIYLILPLLLGMLLTVLFVLLVLAARQAIIIILVIIAPLAFVAYLLPNTEKWFEKWRELFMTMLIFFPAFSAVFGGSQLAGGIIIQNATSIFMMIFGLAVQVAPLVITPLLLKLSGNLLGRIAGMINDPRKGLLDRTRNWSKDRAEMHRLKSLSSPTGFNAMRGFARSGDFANRRVKARTALYNQRLENQFNQTGAAHRLHEDQHLANLDKERIETHTKAVIQAKTNITGSRFHNAAVRLEANKVNLENQSAASDAMLKEYRAGTYRTTNARLNRIQRTMASNVIETAAQTQRGQYAQFVQQENILRAFTDKSTPAAASLSDRLIKIAGNQDTSGMSRALANAQAALNKLRQEALDNKIAQLKAQATTDNIPYAQFAGDILKKHIDGVEASDEETLRGAIEIAGVEADIPLLRKLRRSHLINQQHLTEMFTRNDGVMKGKGAADLLTDPQLEHATEEVMDASIAKVLGTITAAGYKDQKGGNLKDIAKSIDRIITNASASSLTPERKEAAESGLQLAYSAITDALNSKDIRGELGDKIPHLIDIHKALQADPRIGASKSTLEAPYDDIDPRK